MLESLYMHARIKEFVQGTLGCQCPDDVFENVDCVQNFTVADGTVVKARVNVGNRLLVYVVDMNGRTGEDFIRSLLAEGMSERDNRGFNRFRLALCAEDQDNALLLLKDISAGADGHGSSFETVEGLDDRVHAHIIGRGAF